MINNQAVYNIYCCASSSFHTIYCLQKPFYCSQNHLEFSTWEGVEPIYTYGPNTQSLQVVQNGSMIDGMKHCWGIRRGTFLPPRLQQKSSVLFLPMIRNKKGIPSYPFLSKALVPFLSRHPKKSGESTTEDKTELVETHLSFFELGGGVCICLSHTIHECAEVMLTNTATNKKCP